MPDLNDLRRVGFSRKQALTLSQLAGGYAEVPVNSYVQLLSDGVSDPVSTGSGARTIYPDPALTNPDDGWFDGPDLAPQGDPLRCVVLNAGLYLTQINVNFRYLQAATVIPATDVTGYLQLALNIWGPGDSWGSTVTFRTIPDIAGGDFEVATTVYLPQGSTLGPAVGSQLTRKSNGASIAAVAHTAVASVTRYSSQG